jgi:hypothetical protein
MQKVIANLKSKNFNCLEIRNFPAQPDLYRPHRAYRAPYDVADDVAEQSIVISTMRRNRLPKTLSASTISWRTLTGTFAEPRIILNKVVQYWTETYSQYAYPYKRKPESGEVIGLTRPGVCG